MYRLTIRQLWAHKLRFVLTGLAVVLGVAFMSGTTVLTDTMDKTFDDLFATANQDVDVVVQQASTIDSPMGDVRERVPSETLDAVRSVKGVELAAGTVEGFAQLVKADGSVASTDGLGMTIGANWIDEAISPFDLATGHSPRGPDDAVTDVATATREGWSLGDTFSVLTGDGPHELTLVGTATLGDVEGLPGSSLVAVNDATAQKLFGEPGKYDGIMVTAEEGVAPATLVKAIDAELGAGTYDVLTGTQDTKAEQDSFQEDMAFFSQFLMAFAFISLFVGVFIIYNTFSIIVAQRKKDMAMLRAIGASRRQLLIGILLESLLVGIVASAIGLVGGVGMSMGLRALLGAVGLDIPSGELVISTGTIVTAFVVGLTVTIASALAPAFRASRVAPIAALRDVSSDQSATSVARAIIGLGITAAGVAAFAAGIVGEGASGMRLLGTGAIGVIIGIFVLGPIIARPVVRIIGWPAPRLSGTVGRLAQENARRSPKRTAATASALMIGVALVGFITILAASTEQSVERAVDRSLRADYVVDSGSWGDGGFATTLADDVAAEPEVAAVSPFRSTPTEVDGRSAELQAVETSTFDQMFDLKITEGSLPEVGDGELAVRAKEATKQHLAIGDTVPVTFSTGTADLKVAAIYTDAISGTGDSNYLVDLSTFEAHVTDQFDRKIFVAAADGVSAEESTTVLEAAIAEFPNAEIQDQAQFKESITSEIHQMLNLIYGLLALAVVIALIGIANTLALSVHERTRELGLLRAVGMTRGQLRSAIRWESVLIALLGTGLGSLLAVGGAWGIVQAISGSEGGDAISLVFPTTQMLVIVTLAAFAGVIAALGPARRASRLNVLEAIASQ
jgi:putative ABC transport system permease protein